MRPFACPVTHPLPVYTPFNALAIAPQEAEWLRHLDGMPRAQTVSLLGFGLFSMALQLGFERITYRAYQHPNGSYFWINGDHATAIAAAVTRPMASLTLELTTFAPGAATVLAARSQPQVQVEELCFAHRSADGVTLEEALALATLVNRWQVRWVRWWAAEFVPGAIDAFCDALYDADNRALRAYDLCDLTRPEPDDRMDVPALEALTSLNRHRDRAAF